MGKHHGELGALPITGHGHELRRIFYRSEVATLTLAVCLELGDIFNAQGTGVPAGGVGAPASGLAGEA